MLIYERTSKDRKKERHVERVLVCPHCKKTPVRLCAGEGGGYSYIFIHMLLESFFGFKILNSNIFGGFQKKWIFVEYEDFVDIFWGYHKIGLYLGVISLHFRVFSYDQGTEWGGGIFGVAKSSNIFLGAWNSWYFLWWTVDAGPEPTYEEKNQSTPPPPGDYVHLAKTWSSQDYVPLYKNEQGCPGWFCPTFTKITKVKCN